jgi:hypothetical protein
MVLARNAVAILGYGVALCLDPDVFECLEITLEGTRGAGAQLFVNECVAGGCATAGVILASSCDLLQIDPGDGSILAIRVRVKDDAPLGPTRIDFTPVEQASNTIGDCEAVAIDPVVLDGTVEICSPAAARGARR